MSETTKVSTFTAAITTFAEWLRFWTSKSSPLDPQGRRQEQALPAYPTEEQLIYLGKGEGEYEFQKSIPIYESQFDMPTAVADFRVKLSIRQPHDPSAIPPVPEPNTAKKIFSIAVVCHEANRAYCESHGDTSQLPWSEAPEWQRKSALNGVAFHLAHPDSKPSDSHDSWMAEKHREGWIWGPVKDPDLKEHPCMVAFDKLPLEQQKKDHLFLAIVRALS